jgi:hypothetical protein
MAERIEQPNGLQYTGSTTKMAGNVRQAIHFQSRPAAEVVPPLQTASDGGYMPDVPPKVDWQAAARRLLREVENDLKEAHRGGWVWDARGPVVVLFDQGTSDDDFAGRQLEFLRSVIATSGAQERAFLWNECRNAWVMLVTEVHDDVDSAGERGHEWVWASLVHARGALGAGLPPVTVDDYFQGRWPMTQIELYEHEVARQTILAHFSNPNEYKNCQVEW